MLTWPLLTPTAAAPRYRHNRRQRQTSPGAGAAFLWIRRHQGLLYLLNYLVTLVDRKYTVSQNNVPHLACNNFDTRERILKVFWQKCYR